MKAAFVSTPAVAWALPFGAGAHVVLDQPTAAAGSSYRALFRVGHGCDGLATSAISVHIPAGASAAKPMPRPGWTLELRSAPLATPYVLYGKTVERDVADITWTAATPQDVLPDAFYDEFVMRITLPPEPGPIWFAVVQTCTGDGKVVRKEWTQTPASGTSTKGLPMPAALLEVTPAAGEHAHH